MRLLFVVPSFPWPPRAGYEVIACQHMKYLAQWHTVDLLSFANDDTNVDIGELSSFCHRIKTVPINRWHSLVNKLLGLLTGASSLAAGFRSPQMTSTLRQLLSENKYDVVVFQTTSMAQYLPNTFQGCSILNMIDPLVLNGERSLAWMPWAARPWARYKNRLLKRYELDQARRFDRVLLINQADVLDYQKIITGARFDWVPYAVDGERFFPSATERREGAIVISGIMDHRPNVDAVEFFCCDIFPRIRREMPFAKLTIVGSRPTASVRKWATDPNIEVTGTVADVRPYLEKAMVSVCPVRLKVGTQTKVLEAMAMGTPVVTTSAGNHGVGAVSGQHLHVADDPEEFAERVLGLLRREHWEQLSTNGRHFIMENFTWNKSGEKLNSILVQAIEESALKVNCPRIQ